MTERVSRSVEACAVIKLRERPPSLTYITEGLSTDERGLGPANGSSQTSLLFILFKHIHE